MESHKGKEHEEILIECLPWNYNCTSWWFRTPADQLKSIGNLVQQRPNLNRCFPKKKRISLSPTKIQLGTHSTRETVEQCSNALWHSIMSLYWLVHTDPHNGSILIPMYSNWVVQSPTNNQASDFGQIASKSQRIPKVLLTRKFHIVWIVSLPSNSGKWRSLQNPPLKL